MLTAGYWISALLLAAVAVCWAYVLVQPGMLLAPVQAWVREKHKALTVRRWVGWYFQDAPDAEQAERKEVQATLEGQYYTSACLLDGLWWWKIAWGCPACISGQWGFWGYLLLGGEAYRAALAYPSFGTIAAALLSHLGYAAITIFFAALLRALYAWTQTIS